jgi:hypothetical protein
MRVQTFQRFIFIYIDETMKDWNYIKATFSQWIIIQDIDKNIEYEL